VQPAAPGIIKLCEQNTSMGEPVARKVLVELEVPEGRSLEEILRGIRYRVEDRAERLRKLFKRIDEKAARIDRIPPREEIYADRARH